MPSLSPLNYLQRKNNKLPESTDRIQSDQAVTLIKSVDAVLIPTQKDNPIGLFGPAQHPADSFTDRPGTSSGVITGTAPKRPGVQ